MSIRHKSAVKRHKQSVKREQRNSAIRSRVRHLARELREAIGSSQAADAERHLQTTVKAMTKAVSKGVLHRNNASRHISRLARQVNALKSD